MNITFGKKIPKTRGQVLDKRHGRFVPVTCYEYDCKDKSDIEEIKSLNDDDFCYKKILQYNMDNKFYCFQNYKKNTSKFYNLEKDNGEVIAIAQISDDPSSVSVKFIESKRDKKHKYAGQVLLASLAKTVFNEKKYRLVIKNAVKSAMEFYEQVCKFRPIEHYSYEMNRFELRGFIRRTERKTNTKLKDIKEA